MIRTHRFDLVDGNGKKGMAMKVAFASTDRVYINEHFGRAERFLIWDVGPDTAAFSGMVEVKAEGGDEEDRIEARTSVLADCALVYVLQIGGPAAARLVAKKIHPIRSKEQQTIVSVIEQLQEVLRNNPPPWLRKALLKVERPAVPLG
jgi:nitrogen fixation protein NifX